MNRFRVYLLALFAIVASCSNDDGSTGSNGPIGSISVEEFNAVAPPTFEAFTFAYESVIEENENLTSDKNALSRAVFDAITAGGKAVGNTESEDEGDGFFNLSSSMNSAEWRLALTKPIETYKAIPTIGISYQAAVELFSCDEDVQFVGAKADAFKHALWNALMTKRTKKEFAEEMSAAHDSNNADNDIRAMRMHNNSFGKELNLSFPEATEEQLSELLLEQNYMLVTGEQAIKDAGETLVFLSGKRTFDVAMEGTFSNPDSGGPWDIKITFSQCNNIVRGRFTIVRGEALQERRFSGFISGNRMSVDISDPLIFENPEGLQACVEMEMELQGDANKLSGNWTSSNCFQGGVIEIRQT